MNKNKSYGVSSQQAEESRRTNGSNDLTQRNQQSFFDYLKKEPFENGCLKILMIAFALELFLYGIGCIWPTLGSVKWYSAVAIAVVIVVVDVLCAVVSYRQDRDAQA